MLKEMFKFMREGQFHRVEIGRAINVETFSPMIEIKLQKLKEPDKPWVVPPVEEKTYTFNLEVSTDKHVLDGDEAVDKYIAELEQKMINFEEVKQEK
jgi:hypothetical protein